MTRHDYPSATTIAKALTRERRGMHWGKEGIEIAHQNLLAAAKDIPEGEEYAEVRRAVYRALDRIRQARGALTAAYDATVEAMLVAERSEPVLLTNRRLLERYGGQRGENGATMVRNARKERERREVELWRAGAAQEGGRAQAVPGRGDARGLGLDRRAGAAPLPPPTPQRKRAPMTNDQRPTTKYCPDCDAERPLEEFYRMKAKNYAGGYRYSAYCKTHTKARTAAAAKNAPEGSPLRETQQKVKRDWAQQHPENARRNSASYRARKKEGAER
jgi:hypothetical protein